MLALLAGVSARCCLPPGDPPTPTDIPPGVPGVAGVTTGRLGEYVPELVDGLVDFGGEGEKGDVP